MDIVSILGFQSDNNVFSEQFVTIAHSQHQWNNNVTLRILILHNIMLECNQEEMFPFVEKSLHFKVLSWFYIS